MTTIDHSAHAARPMKAQALLIVVCLVISILAIGMQALPHLDAPLSYHAVMEHGQDASRAKQCMDGKQGYLFFNPQSQRWGIVCWLGDRWGIVILTAAWLVVTAYVTKKLKDAKRMRNYMKRQGYLET